MEYNEQAIRKTLIYHDIFTYPLTKEELWQYAISEKPLDKKKFFTKLQQTAVIEKQQGYYFLPKRDVLVNIRKRREVIAKEKLAISFKISKILSLIPSIYFIGVTGSLSMENTKHDDDIDLFIITKNNTLWITRLFILFLLQLLGKRRKKNTTEFTNKICVNLLIEQAQIDFFSKEQNIYTAHEIAQIKPLFQRYAMYQQFISANLWIKKFLPNAIPTPAYRPPLPKGDNSPLHWRGARRAGRVNSLAKKLQLWYMKKHRTSEIITDSVVAFYGAKTKKHILEMYEKKVKAYGI
jgi:hypothetical protein